MRDGRIFAAAVVGVLVAACSSGSTTAPGTLRPANDSDPVAAESRCVGKPAESYRIRDPDSCRNQGSEWRYSGDGRCEAYGTTCDRADRDVGPSTTEGEIRERCLDMPGCGFVEGNGSVTKPTGRCEGTKKPCNAFDEASCKTQVGCEYKQAGGCSSANGIYYLMNADCSYLQISDTVSYSVVKRACEAAIGCTWVP